MNKLFFFDIDGTLLSSGKDVVSEKSKYAIAELKKQGEKVFLCTGKSINDAMPVAKQLNIDNLITSNGQVITIRNNYFSREYFSDSLVTEVLCRCTKNKCLVGVQTDFTNYIYNPLENELQLKNSEQFKRLSIFLKKVGIKVPNIVSSRTNIENVTQFWILEEMSKEFNNLPVRIMPWVEIGYDLVLKNADKANAVESVTAAEEGEIITYAFGDGQNDVKMLKCVDIGIAMGNASRHVKSLANDVTSSVDDDGIYNYLIKNEIIEEMS